MGKIELEALRKRARAYGLSPGAVARILYRPSRQMGLRKPTDRPLRASSPLDVSFPQKWRVAVCKPLKAISVADDLSRVGFLAYCPLGKKMIRARRGGKREWRIHEFAVFGPYVFVGEIDDPLVKDVHDGIIAVIGDSSGAWSLNPDLVKAINQAEIDGKWDETRVRAWEHSKFKQGRKVRIVEGPLSGFDGLVLACEAAGVKVAFSMFGGQHAANFEPKALELA